MGPKTHGRAVPRRMLLAAASGTSVILIVRGGIGIWDLSRMNPEQAGQMPLLLVLIEPWFLIGGVLFGAAAWSYSRKPRERRIAER